jgi:hypothetical protein
LEISGKDVETQKNYTKKVSSDKKQQYSINNLVLIQFLNNFYSKAMLFFRSKKLVLED